MSTAHYSKKLLAIIGYLFLIPPVYFAILWFNTSSSLSPTGRENAFTSHFPDSIQNFYMLIGFSLACCVISLVCTSRSFNQPAVFLRVIDILAAIIAAFIGLINLFQLI